MDCTGGSAHGKTGDRRDIPHFLVGGLARPFRGAVYDDAHTKSKSPPCPSKERRDKDGAPDRIGAGVRF